MITDLIHELEALLEKADPKSVPSRADVILQQLKPEQWVPVLLPYALKHLTTKANGFKNWQKPAPDTVVECCPDDLDLASATAECQRQAALLDHDQAYVKGVLDIFARMETGRWGRCTTYGCKNFLSPHRVLRNPETNLCDRCGNCHPFVIDDEE